MIQNVIPSEKRKNCDQWSQWNYVTTNVK